MNEKMKLEAAALKFTQGVGTTKSIVVHTILFAVCFILPFFGVRFDSVLLILTTAVSLEAIYLAIFIQMSVNRSMESLVEVEKDIDEIQEDVGEISKDVEEISDDVEELTEDIDKIQERNEQDIIIDSTMKNALGNIETDLQRLLKDIEVLKRTQ